MLGDTWIACAISSEPSVVMQVIVDVFNLPQLVMLHLPLVLDDDVLSLASVLHCLPVVVALFDLAKPLVETLALFLRVLNLTNCVLLIRTGGLAGVLALLRCGDLGVRVVRVVAVLAVLRHQGAFAAWGRRESRALQTEWNAESTHSIIYDGRSPAASSMTIYLLNPPFRNVEFSIPCRAKPSYIATATGHSQSRAPSISLAQEIGQAKYPRLAEIAAELAGRVE